VESHERKNNQYIKKKRALLEQKQVFFLSKKLLGFGNLREESKDWWCF
jgi:hypothetical protein